jgi:hypothetical protein
MSTVPAGTAHPSTAAGRDGIQSEDWVKAGATPPRRLLVMLMVALALFVVWRSYEFVELEHSASTSEAQLQQISRLLSDVCRSDPGFRAAHSQTCDLAVEVAERSPAP